MTSEHESSIGAKLAILVAILAAFTVADISRMGPPPTGEAQVDRPGDSPASRPR